MRMPPDSLKIITERLMNIVALSSKILFGGQCKRHGAGDGAAAR